MNSNQELYNMTVDVKVSEVYYDYEQDNYGTVTVEIRLDGKLVAIEGAQATAEIEYFLDERRIPVVDATTLANGCKGDKISEHMIAIGHGIYYLRKTYNGVILES